MMTLNFPQKKINLKDLFPSAKSANSSLTFAMNVDTVIIQCLDWVLLFVHRDKCTVHTEKCTGFYHLHHQKVNLRPPEQESKKGKVNADQKTLKGWKTFSWSTEKSN